MTIGILYICTGNYTVFWDEFYSSCEENFLPKHKKKYFVFTDATSISFEENNKNIVRIYQENLGWPNNTLLRYDIFQKAKYEYLLTDYLFFFNANIIFNTEVGDEIISNLEEHNGLIGAIHPGYTIQKRKLYDYEKNPLSRSFINSHEGKYYFMGGFNGGSTTQFDKLIDCLKNRITADLSDGIIAKWHDESHINRYFIDFPPKVLGVEYINADGFNKGINAKMQILDKNKFGGHALLRGEKKNPLYINPILKLLKRVNRKLTTLLNL